MIYTSGSTGAPKGTLIEHGHVSRLLSATAGIFAFTRSDVWTLFHSPAFDFSVWEIWGALAHGGQVVVIAASARTPEQYYEALRQYGVTVVNQTPQALRGLSRTILERGHDGLRVRVAISGGERLSRGRPELVRRMAGPSPQARQHVRDHGDHRPRDAPHRVGERRTRRGAECHRAPAAGHAGLRARPIGSTGRRRGHGRDVRWRRRCGAWVPGAPPAHRPEVPQRHLPGERRSDVPDRGPRPAPERWQPRIRREVR